MGSNTLFHRPPGIWYRLAMMGLAGLVSTLAAPPTGSEAQAPPITPSGLHTQISAPITVPGGTQFNITGGTRPGAGPNLFHSFGQFGVPTNNIANFLNDSGLATSNILGRVTGGNPSNLFGTIQTSGFGSANLFLMNPAGILFGPQATLNIGGMATFTTADYLKLADGTRFYAAANAAADALLSVAPVATFGFLGPRSGPITVDHSTLQMPEGKGLALVGGAISIVGGRLVAKGAPIELTARESIVVSGVGQKGPTGVLTSTDSAGQRGSVTLAAPTVRLETATVESSAGEIGSAGTITIQGFEGAAAKTVSLDNATVQTTISGGSPASMPGHITITADTVALSNGTHIIANSRGGAPAGDITFNVGTLTSKAGTNRVSINPDDPNSSIQTGVLIESNGIGQAIVLKDDLVTAAGPEAGPAGKITIQGLKGPGSAATSVELDNSTISTRAFGGTAATPPATITITANSVALSNGAVIAANSLGEAPAGNIAFNVDTLRVNVAPDGTPIKGVDGVAIISPNISRDISAGPAGSITISGPGSEPTDAATLVALDKAQVSTGSFSGTATTSGITITADTLVLTAEKGSARFEELSGETGIFTSSQGAAPAAPIAFNVRTLRANVNSDGTPMAHGYVFVASSSQGPASTAGPAGTVTISGPSFEATDAASQVLLNNFAINNFVSGGTTTTAPAAVTVTANTLAFNGRTLTDQLGFRTGLFASSSGGAPAGNIAVNADSLSTNNTIFSSSSTSAAINAGNAGSVTIQGIAGTGSLPTAVTLNHSNMTTEANAGAGGLIALSSATGLTMIESTISAAVSGGSQPGGNITLSAGNQIALTGRSVISAQSTGLGDAGNILINAGQNFSSTNSKVTTEAAQASGGNITVAAAGVIQLTNSQINASVQGSTTTVGGNITIDPQFVILQNSQILAQATQGQGGNIAITTNALVSDTTSLVDASSQFGVNGTVRVQSPNAPAAGKIVPLSKTPLETIPLLSQPCAAMAVGEFSSFVVAGRSGVPTEPGGWLASPLAVLGVDAGLGAGEEREGTNAAAPLANVNEILSLRRLPASDTVANILTNWTGDCGS